VYKLKKDIEGYMVKIGHLEGENAILVEKNKKHINNVIVSENRNLDNLT